MNIGKVGQEVKNISPEYKDCKEIVVKEGIPLKKVHDEAKATARNILNYKTKGT